MVAADSNATSITLLQSVDCGALYLRKNGQLNVNGWDSVTAAQNAVRARVDALACHEPTAQLLACAGVRMHGITVADQTTLALKPFQQLLWRPLFTELWLACRVGPPTTTPQPVFSQFCKGWCATELRSWEDKCMWKNTCSGCAQCFSECNCYHRHRTRYHQ